MKAITILFIFLFVGCGSQYRPIHTSQASTVPHDHLTKKCSQIDIYFNCILNHFQEIKTAIMLGQDISKDISKQCLREQGINTQSGDDLDSMKMGSDITNKCKYQVTDYVGDYDFFIQFMSCGKREIKNKINCP